MSKEESRVGARCDECDAVINKWGGYLYKPSPPADLLRMGFAILSVREFLLCSKCAAKVPKASKLAALEWWWHNPRGSPLFLPDPDGEGEKTEATRGKEKKSQRKSPPRERLLRPKPQPRERRRPSRKPAGPTRKKVAAKKAIPSTSPKSADEWLSQLSSSLIPVDRRVQIAYEFEDEYYEAVEGKLQEVLIADVALRKAILARYEAERSADMSRLLRYTDEAAMTAEREAARRKLPKDPAKLSDTDL